MYLAVNKKSESKKLHIPKNTYTFAPILRKRIMTKKENTVYAAIFSGNMPDNETHFFIAKGKLFLI